MTDNNTEPVRWLSFRNLYTCDVLAMGFEDFYFFWPTRNSTFDPECLYHSLDQLDDISCGSFGFQPSEDPLICARRTMLSVFTSIPGFHMHSFIHSIRVRLKSIRRGAFNMLDFPDAHNVARCNGLYEEFLVSVMDIMISMIMRRRWEDVPTSLQRIHPQIRADHHIALAMGVHARLGAGSVLSMLDGDLVHSVCDLV